jgi:hypothetical protein
MWRFLTRGAGGLMIVGFFLPWVSGSCDPQAARSLGAGVNLPSITFSGFQLAVGPQVQTGFGTQQLPGSVGLWLILGMAIAAIVVTFVVAQSKLAAGGVLAAGLIALGPLLNAWQSFEAARNPFIKVTVEPGLWLTLLGMVGLALGGVLGLRDRSTIPVTVPWTGPLPGTAPPAPPPQAPPLVSRQQAPPPPPPYPPAAPVPAAQPAAGARIFCSQCGQPNTRGVNFCVQCGAQLRIPDAPTSTGGSMPVNPSPPSGNPAPPTPPPQGGTGSGYVWKQLDEP